MCGVCYRAGMSVYIIDEYDNDTSWRCARVCVWAPVWSNGVTV